MDVLTEETNSCRGSISTTLRAVQGDVEFHSFHNYHDDGPPILDRSFMFPSPSLAYAD